MKSGIINHSDSNLMHYHFSKSITHSKVLIILLNFSKHLITTFKFIFNLIFTLTNYTSDDDSNINNCYKETYYFEDSIDLRLKASQRTFL